jgi:hypothetical protein
MNQCCESGSACFWASESASGSFHHQAKIVTTLDFDRFVTPLRLFTSVPHPDPYVFGPSGFVRQIYWSASGSVPKWHGSTTLAWIDGYGMFLINCMWILTEKFWKWGTSAGTNLHWKSWYMDPRTLEAWLRIRIRIRIIFLVENEKKPHKQFCVHRYLP